MSEQEKYKNMLRRVIEETESHKIKSSQELVQTLVSELTNSVSAKRNKTGTVAK